MGVIIRQSIKATVINYIGAFIGFLTTFFVLTAFLKPEEIGLTKVLYELAALVAGFSQLGTSASAMRFFPYFKDPEKKHNGFFFYLLLMPAIGLTIFVSLFLLLREPILGFFSVKSPLLQDYYVWVIPLIVFLTFWAVWETYANVLMRIVIPKFIREIGVRLLLVIIYVLYAFKYMDLQQMVMSYVSVYGIAMFASLFYISRITSISLKHDISFVDRSLFLQIMKYTCFLLVGAISGNVIGQLDLFMVSACMGLDYAGIFTIATYIALVIEIPSRSMLAISSPIAATALKNGDLQGANQLYKKVALHQLISTSSLFFIIWINIDNIFAILPNGEVYEKGKWVVFFIGLARIVANTLTFSSVLISFSRYYYWGLYFTFFLTLFTIITNYLFIPIWGITGAALATLLTCIISYSLQQWIVLIKIKGNPYSKSMLKQLGIIIFLLILNECLPIIKNPYVDMLYRTFLLVFGLLFFVFRCKVSKEINDYLRMLWMRFTHE